MKIFIPGNVPSLKNGKQIVNVPSKNGGIRPILVPSKTHKKYKHATAHEWMSNREIFHRMAENHNKPLVVGFFFYRDSRRSFDYLNAIQTCEDLMVKHGWIPDDNADELRPIPLGYCYAHTRNPGVEIEILTPNTQ